MSSAEGEGRQTQINVFLLEEIMLESVLPFCFSFVLTLLQSVTVLHLLVIFKVCGIFYICQIQILCSLFTVLKPVLANCQGFILLVIHSRPFVICSPGASGVFLCLCSLGFWCCLGLLSWWPLLLFNLLCLVCDMQEKHHCVSSVSSWYKILPRFAEASSCLWF